MRCWYRTVRAGNTAYYDGGRLKDWCFVQYSVQVPTLVRAFWIKWRIRIEKSDAFLVFLGGRPPYLCLDKSSALLLSVFMGRKKNTLKLMYVFMWVLQRRKKVWFAEMRNVLFDDLSDVFKKMTSVVCLVLGRRREVAIFSYLKGKHTGHQAFPDKAAVLAPVWTHPVVCSSSNSILKTFCVWNSRNQLHGVLTCHVSFVCFCLPFHLVQNQVDFLILFHPHVFFSLLPHTKKFSIVFWEAFCQTACSDGCDCCSQSWWIYTAWLLAWFGMPIVSRISWSIVVFVHSRGCSQSSFLSSGAAIWRGRSFGTALKTPVSWQPQTKETELKIRKVPIWDSKEEQGTRFVEGKNRITWENWMIETKMMWTGTNTEVSMNRVGQKHFCLGTKGSAS